MNAEYQSHKPVWEMLKPHVFAQMALSQSLAWATPPEEPPTNFPDWYPATLDPAVLAHGHGELASPLSEW